MLTFKKVWTVAEDYKKGDKLDIYFDGFGGTHVERHVSPEEREQIRLKKRRSALEEELDRVNKALDAA